jgi:hypothetical protein
MRTAVDGNAMGLAAAKMAVVQETIHRHRHTRLLVVFPLWFDCVLFIAPEALIRRDKKKRYTPPEKNCITLDLMTSTYTIKYSLTNIFIVYHIQMADGWEGGYRADGSKHPPLREGPTVAAAAEEL